VNGFLGQLDLALARVAKEYIPESVIRFCAELAYVFHCYQFDNSLKDVPSGEAWSWLSLIQSIPIVLP
jgi:hypothetical protein